MLRYLKDFFFKIMLISKDNKDAAFLLHYNSNIFYLLPKKEIVTRWYLGTISIS